MELRIGVGCGFLTLRLCVFLTSPQFVLSDNYQIIIDFIGKIEL